MTEPTITEVREANQRLAMELRQVAMLLRAQALSCEAAAHALVPQRGRPRTA